MFHFTSDYLVSTTITFFFQNTLLFIFAFWLWSYLTIAPILVEINIYSAILTEDMISAIIFIIFWDFLIFYQIFLSLQVKRSLIVTSKQGIYEVLHELRNHLKLFLDAPSAGHQDPRPRVSDERPDIWNSDIRHDAAIGHGSSP